MINLHLYPSLKKHVPANRIIEKIEAAYNSDALHFHLEKMKFDQIYTKPIDFSGYDILKILYWTEQEVFLSLYTQSYFKWKFAPVNAYKDSSLADHIFFNTRNLNSRTENEWEETLWHELVHIADSLSPNRFDHGDNYLKGKDESAPVKFAKFMASFKLKEVENQNGFKIKKVEYANG